MRCIMKNIYLYDDLLLFGIVCSFIVE